MWMGPFRPAFATESVSILRPRHGVLVVHTLLWPEDIREPGDITPPAPVTDREPDLAERLIGETAGVNIADIHDDYGAALDQVITAKPEGHDWVEPAEPAAPTDLMAALEESMRRARRR
jgi:DNA end-binding protein Ku